MAGNACRKGEVLLILYGRLSKGTKTIKQIHVEKDDSKGTFHDRLEESLIEICRELDIPVPMWLKKNTSEFAMYRKTSFEKDQFIESVNFDKFEIRIEI